MAKNYYDILGISSPAMRKHFEDVEKQLEAYKNSAVASFTIPINSFIEDVDFYQCFWSDAMFTGNYFNHIYDLYLPIYSEDGGLLRHDKINLIASRDLREDNELGDRFYNAVLQVRENGLMILISKKLYGTFDASSNQAGFILKVV